MQRSQKSIALALGMLLVASGLLVLFLFPPTQHAFYPRCMLHSTTGLSCPGCGCLRAMHQLLHGNLKDAFFLNPLLMLAMPFLGVAIFCRCYNYFTGRELVRFSLPAAWIWALFWVIVAFTVLRNLPAFSWMRA